MHNLYYLFCYTQRRDAKIGQLLTECIFYETVTLLETVRVAKDS
jgi:hypothetical protein